VMLAKCSNPSCFAPFRYLENGKLFCLEDDPPLGGSVGNRTEYFWLCDRCSSTMTLRLGEDENVAAVPIPKSIRSVPNSDALMSVDRKKGVMLRCVRFALSEQLRDRTRTRQNDEQDVA